MYFLYIDESGLHDPYPDKKKNENEVVDRYKFFTLGGIIVHDNTRHLFTEHFDNLMSKYFKGITLPPKFKLHYQELRQKKPPCDKLSDPDRYAIMDAVFDKIVSCDCKLLSVTLDKEKHYKKYILPADPLGYTLYVMLERFQYFLDDVDDNGIVIYERYHSNLRHLVDRTHRWLINLGTFPIRTDFNAIASVIVNGDPCVEPILQYADFFAYVPWFSHTHKWNKRNRYDQIMHKYYRHNDIPSKRGNVTL